MTARPPRIDLNCDLGEGFPHDAELIALVSSVNIACGGHAGDDETMRTAVRVSRNSGVAIGAHPGYEDRANFGRIDIVLPPNEIAALVHRQVKRLADIAQAESATLHHVKPHGALYHAAGRDRDVSTAIVMAVRAIDPRLGLVGPPNSQLAAVAQAAGMRFIAEGFVDRRYQPDGNLAPRSQPNGLIDSDVDAVGQALALVTRGQVISMNGQMIRLDVQTLCVHGDGPHAVTFLTGLRDALNQHGISVQCP